MPDSQQQHDFDNHYQIVERQKTGRKENTTGKSADYQTMNIG
jgi:hypothetical protein